ncbi:MAG: bacterioferritin, partial [Proteobacteria bacterium]
MKGDPKIIEALNDILTGELTAINQYFLHARMCKDWGFEKIAKKVWLESIDEMKHAEKLMDRVLFLEGIPNVQRLLKINIGENVKEQFESDLKLEYEAVGKL